MSSGSGGALRGVVGAVLRTSGAGAGDKAGGRPGPLRLLLGSAAALRGPAAATVRLADVRIHQGIEVRKIYTIAALQGLALAPRRLRHGLERARRHGARPLGRALDVFHRTDLVGVDEHRRLVGPVDLVALRVARLENSQTQSDRTPRFALGRRQRPP